MTRRVLVAYDTVNNTTTDVAWHIGKELAAQGDLVDVRRVGQVSILAGYDAAVVGCPVIIGKWTKDAVAFLDRCKDGLCGIPVALFTTCLATLSADGREKVMANQITPLLGQFPGLKPVSVGIFTGVLDYDTYAEAARPRMREMNKARGAPAEGRHDYRDYNAMSAWVKDLRALPAWKGQ